MKVLSMAAVLLGAVLAGCTLSGEPANPNRLAPKVVLSPREDGNVTVYVHSAFGEYDYDWISLEVDNQTVANRTRAYSLETQVPATGFFLSVRAGASDQVYELRGRVDVDATRERARASFLDAEGDWSDARAFAFPLERILDRVSTEGRA